MTRIMFPSLNLSTPLAPLHAENECVQRWLICLKPSSPCSLYTSFWRRENAQRLTVTAKSRRTPLSSKSLTSSGIELWREERGAAGCATERKKTEKQFRLNTEKSFERQTELSLRGEIAERWNVHSCQRMAAVLSLRLHSEGSQRAQKLWCREKKKKEEEGVKTKPVMRFFANMWSKASDFWQLFSLSGRREEVFRQHDLFSCCQSEASCGGAIISKFTSRARSTLCRVMDVMIWIFLVVFHPTGWYWGPDLHFASVSSDFRCVFCLEIWEKKNAARKRSLPLSFLHINVRKTHPNNNSRYD